MRGAKLTDDVIALCRRLRSERLLSFAEIAAETGIPTGTLHPFLRDISLPKTEMQRRRANALIVARKARAERRPIREKRVSPFFSVIQARVKTTDQKGAIAEAAAIFRMKAWGLVPHIPMCAGGKSDIVVFVPDTGRLARVQVKCVARAKFGQPIGQLRSRSGGKMSVRYAADDFDFYVGYDMREDVCFVYSVLELASSKFTKAMSFDAAERWDKIINDSVAQLE